MRPLGLAIAMLGVTTALLVGPRGSLVATAVAGPPSEGAADRAEEPRGDTAPVVPGSPAVSGGATYQYNPTGKRDPFRPLALVRKQASPAAEPLTPLQRYDIGQLKLVGIVFDLNPPRAMVEDSSGLGFIVTPGTPVGPNGGVVTAIKPRQVVVEEWYTDVIGERHRKELTLELPSDESEGKK
jgi:type IV pilus assembly protein PilP